MHTYDKQYNVTRSSRYGILENFIIHYYNCYASYCFISSSISCISLCSYKGIVKKEKEKSTKENKWGKERAKRRGEEVTKRKKKGGEKIKKTSAERNYNTTAGKYLVLFATIGEKLSRVTSCGAPHRK